jgi:hypothetical protein
LPLKRVFIDESKNGRIKMKSNRILLFFLLIFFVFPISSYADQLEDAKAAIEDKAFGKAYELLCPLAEEGNAEAQTLLGFLYINGEGVEKDMTKGLSWVMKAGTQGYEPARVHALNMCLELGKEGDAAAMYNVGYMCLNGWGGEQDANTCVGWLDTAAKLGHIRSGNVLSTIYTKGSFGINPDKEKASYYSNLATAFAMGFDGTWTGSFTGMGGQPMTITFNFKEDGDALTGTVSGGPGQWFPIKDGKIDGTNISFAVDMEFNKMKSTNKYNGVLLGDELKLSFIINTGGGGGFGGPRGKGGDPPSTTFIAKRIR